ncbi:MAG TPA: glycosyltransferase family 9 protein [Blastocatellia bacterium]|nr:glycosyltransferase family 9 protein [Blastocatellia bacterium]
MKLLVIKLSSIGDVVHALPAVSLIRRELPNAEISWIVERRASDVLVGSPVIDDLIVIDSRSWRAQPFSPATIEDYKSCRRRLGTGFDVAIDFQGLLKSGIVASFSGATRRIGFETSELRESVSRYWLTEQVTTSQCQHVIQKNCALARAALNQSDTAPLSESTLLGNYEFPIALSRDDELYAGQIREQMGGAFAILNPGGGWPTKLWAAQNYGALADRLWTERSLPSIVTYGPGEELLARTVADSSNSGRCTPVPSTLKQFVALSRQASVFVGGDTGPLHLAAAAGTPIVGLYGPTASARNGPFHPDDITVSRDLWCRANCHRRKCWHWECMDIRVDSVAAAVADRLDRIVSLGAMK